METKEDVYLLKKMIEDLVLQFHDIDFSILSIKSDLMSIKSQVQQYQKSNESQEKTFINQVFSIPTLQQINPTEKIVFPTHSNIPTFNHYLEGLKRQNIPFSTGNEGVPTDRQTLQQTDRHSILKENHIKNTLDDASKILESLDSLKKEIRLKFKKLTEQEILVFSLIYQLEEEKGFCDYKILSQKLSLSESSARDYVGKLIKKGIPVEKIRINNHLIQLKISEQLKKIAPLSTILSLRDL
jgi:hypothetical protein